MRVRLTSPKSYDDLVEALLDDVGTDPIPIHGGSALTYVVPSSLMVVEENEPLNVAALALDAKLAALATKVTTT